MRIEHGSGSRPGRVRRENEDAYLAQPPVFLVADGMGGHTRGRSASALAVREFARLDGSRPLTADDVLTALRAADLGVRRLGSAADEGGAPGTTVAGLVEVDIDGRAYWLVVNVGDSRVYTLDARGFRQLSVDHSLVQELLDAGRLNAAELRTHRDRHVITRALGADGASEADCWLLPVTSRSRLLVCSDGLPGVLDDDEIADVLRSEPVPQYAVDALLDQVVGRGGRDDVSVVVVDVLADNSVHDDLEVDVLDGGGLTAPRPVASA